MANLPFKSTIKMVLGKSSDFSDKLFDEFESSTDSGYPMGIRQDQYITSTNSAALSFGGMTRARYVWIKTNVNSRVILNGGTLAFPLRVGSNSSAFLFTKCSATSITLVNSSVASGRYEYCLVGS